ncbi:uncharacterized protein LOC111086990 [Limulus polyphemus]|uniref:Uncharacterized protein LOC111086990 n=1 Tax=Limulus polyphemus TaxID=6850 RepID=A0ABM1SVQ1_LIMPO|nr:uncharacterized protein LOC111086990 [Limulus polyphemus]XP_022247707.1 uncharacterized protein LOC111086990 [Limulus polyphemus]XP_022247708.1 uncharacterized protein LOC111086990 [Limulus polyphemus]XP_022247709.1 uncharacterized protein LOC111086990 [Limulus polyphemus]XP_022247710.1 uncharacterized protein LOC111086990 [Limulus polyphemus]XP_022247711.1 uncharacterized protein LOC111086990 [Limulus polyphemus]
MAGQTATLQKRKAIFSFLTPSQCSRVSYSVQKSRLTRTLLNHECFQEGQVFGTMEKGVMYPIIHRKEIQPSYNSQPIKLLDPSTLGDDYILKQGCYTEERHLQLDIQQPKDDSTSYHPCFILVGFRSLDDTFSEVLEDSWKDWTGARMIYMNLADDFGLSSITFYRRNVPRDIELFMYILVAECHRVTSHNKIAILDFVHRFRVERMFGFVSLYKQEIQLTTSALINSIMSDVEETNRQLDI